MHISMIPPPPVTTRRGYWSADTIPPTFYPCWSGATERCLAGSTCAEGHAGRLCSQCSANYAPGSDGACVPCGGSTAGPATYIFIVLCVLMFGFTSAVGVLMVLVKCKKRAINATTKSVYLLDALEKKARKAYESLSMKLKILVAFEQIAGSFRATFSIPFPMSYTVFMSSISGMVDLDLPAMMNLGCAVSINYMHMLVLKTMGALVVFTVIAGLGECESLMECKWMFMLPFLVE